MIFCRLDCWQFPLSKTHRFHVQKLAQGFVQNGYGDLGAVKFDDLKHLTKQDVVYVTSHFWTDPRLKLIRGKLLEKLLDAIEANECRFFLWSFHDVAKSVDFKFPSFGNVIHVGEDFDPGRDPLEEHVARFRQSNVVYKLKYSSPFLPMGKPYFNPSELRQFDFNYFGTAYKKNWIIRLGHEFSGNVKFFPPKVNEYERVDSFRNSKVSLCFHHNDSLRKGIVTERFAEALSAGGIIVHDNSSLIAEYAAEPGIIYCDSIEECSKALRSILGMSFKEQDMLRRRNLEVWRQSGRSYHKQAESILKALYG